MTNHCLKSLNVCNNNLDTIAAFTLCVGIMENKSLESVILDGNPIGIKGCTAMMMIPLVHGGRVSLSAKQCNISFDDPDWFNFDRLPGRYILQLSNPFERAISLMLLRMVAFHRSCVFTHVEYDSTGTAFNSKPQVVKGNKKCITKKLNLISSYYNIEHLLNDHQRAVATKMRQLIVSATDAVQASKLFEDVDLNKNGSLDKIELGKLISSMGIDFTDFKLRQTMATFDFDGSGSMEVDEFIAFLESSRTEWENHVSDLTMLPIIIVNEATESSINNTYYVDDSNRFIPPNTGALLMDITNERIFKDVFRTLASCDKVYTDKVAEATPDPELMKQVCL